MILPKNGSVVIVDDMYKEALPLIQVLSQNAVPLYYFDGKKNMPSEPLKNIRLLFLDMRYADGVTNTKDTISTLMSIIECIVHKDNGPYTILVWSKHDGEDLQAFKEAVKTDDGFILKPLTILNLEKKECFETVHHENEKVKGFLASITEIAATNETVCSKLDLGAIKDLESMAKESIRILKKDGLEIIQNKINTELNTLGAFNLFFLWENIVNDSSAGIINSISGNFEIEDNWNDNINSILYKMAEANAGAPNLLDKEGEVINELVVKNVLYSFNDILPDEIGNILNGSMYNVENIIIKQEKKLSLIKEGDLIHSLEKDNNKYVYYQNGQFKKNFKSIYELLNKDHDDKASCVNLGKIHIDRIAFINSKLLLQTVLSDSIQPGNVYLHDDKLEKIEQVLTEVIDTKKFKLDDEKLKEIYGKCKFLELEVSPSCDFAQSKWKVNRILPGVAIPFEEAEYLKGQGEYFYTTPVIKMEDENYYLLFNFKLFSSTDFNHLEGLKPAFLLRSILQIEIKNRLSQHFLRAGIVNLNL